MTYEKPDPKSPQTPISGALPNPAWELLSTLIVCGSVLSRSLSSSPHLKHLSNSHLISSSHIHSDYSPHPQQPHSLWLQPPSPAATFTLTTAPISDSHFLSPVGDFAHPISSSPLHSLAAALWVRPQLPPLSFGCSCHPHCLRVSLLPRTCTSPTVHRMNLVIPQMATPHLRPTPKVAEEQTPKSWTLPLTPRGQVPAQHCYSLWLGQQGDCPAMCFRPHPCRPVATGLHPQTTLEVKHSSPS